MLARVAARVAFLPFLTLPYIALLCPTLPCLALPCLALCQAFPLTVEEHRAAIDRHHFKTF